jgi:hypothetical protein
MDAEAAMTAAAAEAEAREAEWAETERDERIRLRAEWQAQLDRSQRAEADLSDSKQLQKERPPRVGDDLAPGIGPSSGQVFEGERLEDKSIDEEARRQLISANDALMAYRREREAEERAAERAMADAARAAAADAEAMEEAHRMAERDERRRLDLENRAMMRAAALGREEVARRGAAEAAAEHAATMRSAMLAETHGVAAGEGGRVRRDHYKGMSQEQLAGVRAVQEMQAAQLAAQREADRARERAVADAARRAAEEAERREADAEAARRAEQRAYFNEIRAQQRSDRVRRQRDTQQRKERFDETAGGVLSGFGVSLK